MRLAGFALVLAGVVSAGVEKKRTAYYLSVFDTCLGGCQEGTVSFRKNDKMAHLAWEIMRTEHVTL